MAYYSYNQQTGIRKLIVERDVLEFVGKSEEDCDLQYHNYLMENDTEYKADYQRDYNTPLEIKVVKTTNYQPYISSLVGVGGEAPYGHGNYFSMLIDGNEYAVINMWKENFEDAIRRFNLSEVEFEVINGHMVVVTSEEIDPRWKMEPFLKYNLRRGITTATRHKIFERYGAQG